MTNIGKIASLSPELREQVNERLDRAEPAEAILTWLNTRLEVQHLIATQYNHNPISKQNLSEYKQNTFRAWRLRRDAVRFAENLKADRLALREHDAEAESISDELAHWTAIRYQAMAQAATADADDNPQAEFERLRKFAADVLALRRSDRLAARVKIEQERLELRQEMAVYNDQIADPNPPPPKPYQPYPSPLDLARWRVFGDAVEPLLEHPQYEHPACII